MTAPTRAAGDGIGTNAVGGGERAVPYHCPFCAEEDLRPHGTTHGAWHCRTCLRVFSVRFLGLAEHERWGEVATPSVPAPSTQRPELLSDVATAPTPTTTGGSR